MKNLVANNIATLKPYEPGKPIDELERELGISNSIKLASNENPLGPSPKAVEAMQKAMTEAHMYPDGAAFRLREAVSKKFNVPMDQVITGNGSNELLTLAARTFCGPGENAVISDYGFVAYRIVLTAANVPFTSVAVQPNFAQDLDALAAACDANTKILFLANPNNPTGTYVGQKALQNFLKTVPEHVVVVMDEAYVEYADAPDYASALDMRDTRERLLICRTFSKCYGLGGMRIGFGVGTPEMIDFMNRIREPFNVSILGQAAGIAALEDDAFVERTVKCNAEAKLLLEKGLTELGLPFVPSQTNFLLVEFPRHNGRAIAMDVYNAMLRHGVIVRPTAGYGLPDYLRITVGTPEQITRCINALSAVLKEVRI
jgi:histidinol-phosphate aminotransferase